MIGSIECFYSICFTLGELLKLAGAYLHIYQYVWALRKSALIYRVVCRFHVIAYHVVEWSPYFLEN